MKTNLDLMTTWFEEVWNQGDESAIDRYFAKDGLAHGIYDQTLDHEAYKGSFHAFRGAFPNIHIEILDALEAGDKIAVRCVATFDNSTSPPKTFEGMVFVTVRDGQIYEAWNCWDFLGMLEKMGKLPGNSLGKGLAE